MDSNKNFKKLLNEIAVESGFEPAFGGWVKESNEFIIILELQKSNLGNYYYLNIKLYIKGLFGMIRCVNKELVKIDMGDLFTRQPVQYDAIFNLEDLVGNDERARKLEEFFIDFLIPFGNKAMTKAGIKELVGNKQLGLFPATKIELEKMNILN